MIRSTRKAKNLKARTLFKKAWDESSVVGVLLPSLTEELLFKLRTYCL